MGVPETTTEEARPWYPIGKWFHAGGRGGPGTFMSRPALAVWYSLAPVKRDQVS